MTTGPVVDQFRAGGVIIVGVDGAAWVRDCKKQKESVSTRVSILDISILSYHKVVSILRCIQVHWKKGSF